MKKIYLVTALTVFAVISLVFLAPAGCTADDKAPPAQIAESPVATKAAKTEPVENTAPAPEETVPDQTTAQAQPSQQPPAKPASRARYEAGRHYTVLNPAQPTSSSPDKIEVAELFWYGCPHCYTLEPYMQRWLKDLPANVSFVRLPATLNPSWRIHARAFYAADALGVGDKMHTILFETIHDKGQQLGTEDEIARLFAENGVDEKEFRDAFSSFAVETKLGRSDTLARRYRATAVPMLIVNGRYTTGGRQAGGNQQMLDVVNYLIEQESAR